MNRKLPSQTYKKAKAKASAKCTSSYNAILIKKRHISCFAYISNLMFELVAFFTIIFVTYVNFMHNKINET